MKTQRLIGSCRIIIFVFLTGLLMDWANRAYSMRLSIGDGDPLDLTTLQQTSLELFDETGDRTGLLGAVDIGVKDGAWEGTLGDGHYQLVNQVEPGAVRYYYIGSVPGGDADKCLSEGAVSVDVTVTSKMNSSGAGLLFRYDPTTRNYYAFILFNGGGHGIYHRTEDGFKPVISGASKMVRDDVNQLAIVAEETKMMFYINGTRVACADDEQAPGGHVGIIAVGTGCFGFDHFATYAQRSAVVQEEEIPAEPEPLVADHPKAPPSAEPPPNPLAMRDPYTGVFSNDQLALTLRGRHDAYDGIIAFGGSTFVVTAQAAPEGIQGQFTSEGYPYAFHALLKEDVLRFYTGDATYYLSREK